MKERFKKFLNSETAILAGIFLLAYVLRILPYLLGYNLPFTDDGMRDFDQILYIIENGRINFYDTAFYFGSFPALHLLVFFISRLGFDPLTAFLFVPQIFPSLGLIFFYLFLKKYFPKKESLLAVFLIAIFGPHVHWSAQPVRETIGLFFFPLLIYLFDKVFSSFNSKSTPLYFVLLAGCFSLLIFSHHWSTLMVLLTLFVYSLVFLKKGKVIFYALGLLTAFFMAALTYWFLVFEMAYKLFTEATKFSLLAPAVVITVFLLIVFIEKFKGRLSLLKRTPFQISAFAALPLALIFGLHFLPVNYPIQIILPLVLYVLFLLVGFFYAAEKNINKFMFLNVIYVAFFIIAALYFSAGETVFQMPFDPFRTIEFAIFPSSIIIAYGLMVFKNHFPRAFVPVMLVLVFLGSLVYPPVFISGKRLNGTPFYDVRSDIRYISTGAQKLINWAHDNYLSVYSPRPEVLMYQKVFHKPRQNNLILLTESDIFLKDNITLVNDPILKVPDLSQWKYDINYEFILVKSDKDYLVIPRVLVDLSDVVAVNQTDKKVLDFLKSFDRDSSGLEFFGQVDLVSLERAELLYFDAEITEINVSEKFFKDTKYQASFTVRNTGTATWLKEDGLKLKGKLIPHSYDLPTDVLPNQEVVFSFNDVIDEVLDSSYFQYQMHEENFGYFGEQTPVLELKYQQ